MWCRTCQQDVPALREKDSLDICCRRCGTVVGKNHGAIIWRVDQKQSVDPHAPSEPSVVLSVGGSQAKSAANSKREEVMPREKASPRVETPKRDDRVGRVNRGANTNSDSTIPENKTFERVDSPAKLESIEHASEKKLSIDQMDELAEQVADELAHIDRIVKSWGHGRTLRYDSSHERSNTTTPAKRSTESTPARNNSVSRREKSASVSERTILTRSPVLSSTKTAWQWSSVFVRVGKLCLFSGLLMGLVTVNEFQAEWSRFALALTSLGAFAAISGLTWQLSELEPDQPKKREMATFSIPPKDD